jgi:hypothetical protein
VSALSASVLPRSTRFVQSIPGQVHAVLHARAARFGATEAEEQQAHDIADEILARDPLAGGWATYMGEQAWKCSARHDFQRAA